MKTKELTIPQIQPFKDPTEGPLLKQAKALVIKTATDYLHAGELLKGIKALRRKIEDHYDAIKRPLNDLRKQVLSMEADDLDDVVKAERLVGGAIALYDHEERERREAERIRLQAEADLRAKEQAKALSKSLLKQAEQYTGEIAKVLKAEAKAVLANPVSEEVTLPDAPKVPGLSVRTQTSAEVQDLRALVAAVAKGTVPLEAVMPNQPFLNGLARSLGDDLKFPGVVVVRRKIVAG